MQISDWIIPSVLVLVVVYGYIKKVDVFSTFVEGAKEGLQTVVSIAPVLVGLVTAIGLLQASGALDGLVALLRPITQFLGLPAEVAPLALLKPISGSGSLSVCDYLLKNFGPDSFTGRLASVMQSSTETTFYVVAVYYGSVRISNTKYTVPAALVGDVVGIVASVCFVHLLFG